MGVTSLWDPLEVAARRQSLERLQGKRVAVDASIWLVQLLKAMRDDRGDVVPNAHVLGFFRRICKLLFNKVQPVFVFDGQTPALKRQTVAARRRMRERGNAKLRRTAEKLLMNKLRARQLSAARAAAQAGDPAEPSGTTEPGPPGVPPSGSGSTVAPDTSNDALLAASLSKEDERKLARLRGAPHDSDDEAIIELDRPGDDDDDDDDDADDDAGADDIAVEELVDENGEIDPEIIAQLPPSVAFEMTQKLRDQRFGKTRAQLQEVAERPADFSQRQIDAYLKSGELRRNIDKTMKQIGGGELADMPGAVSKRIAHDENREYIFSTNYDDGRATTVDAKQSGDAPMMRGGERFRRPLPARGGRGGRGRSHYARVMAVARAAESKPKMKVHGVPSILPKPHDVANVVEPESLDLVKEEEPPDEADLDICFEVPSDGGGAEEDDDTEWEDAGPAAAEQPAATALDADDEDMEWEDAGYGTAANGAHSPRVDVEQRPHADDSVSRRDVYSVAHGFLRGRNLADWERGDTRVLEPVHESEAARDAREEAELQRVLRQSLQTARANAVAEAPGAPGSSSAGAGPSGSGAGPSGSDAQHEVVELDLDDEEGGDDEERDAGLQRAIAQSLEPPSPAPEPEPEPDVEDTAVLIRGNGAFMRLATPQELVEFARSIRFGRPAVIPAPSELKNRPVTVRYLGKEWQLKLPLGPGMLDIANACIEEQARHSVKRFVASVQAPAKPDDGEAAVEPSGSLDAGGTDALTIDAPAGAEVGAPHSPAARVSDAKNAAPSRAGPQPDAPLPTTIESPAEAEMEASSPARQTADPDAQHAVVNAPFSAVQLPSQPSAPPVTAQASLSPPPPPLHIETLPPARMPLPPTQQPQQQQQQSPAPPRLARLMPPEHVLPPPPDFTAEEEEALLAEADRDRELNEQLSSPPSQPQGNVRTATEAEEALLAALDDEHSYQMRLQHRQAQIDEIDRQDALLDAERAALEADVRRNAKYSEEPTPEMYTDIQELLMLFGIPYVIAPSEAEAQCAMLEELKLVDGIVTDDSDVFLFGGRKVYRYLFKEKEYMQAYDMASIQEQLGLDRESMIMLALLLGSDYTPGVAGVGIVNAMEIIRAFPGLDGLKKFRKWLEMPDAGIVTGQVAVGEDDTEAQKQFKLSHNKYRRRWELPGDFPSERVVQAYSSPQVERQKERFEWGKPDLPMLREFTERKLGWPSQKTDEILDDVMKRWESHETQRQIDDFFRPTFDQSFAKVRSKRVLNAVKGLTGRHDPSIALGDVRAEPAPKKRKKPASAGGRGAGRGRGRGRGRRRAAAAEADDEDDDADLEELETGTAPARRPRAPRRGSKAPERFCDLVQHAGGEGSDSDDDGASPGRSVRRKPNRLADSDEEFAPGPAEVVDLVDEVDEHTESGGDVAAGFAFVTPSAR